MANVNGLYLEACNAMHRNDEDSLSNILVPLISMRSNEELTRDEAVLVESLLEEVQMFVPNALETAIGKIRLANETICRGPAGGLIN